MGTNGTPQTAFASSAVWGTEGQSGSKVDLLIEDIVAIYRTLKLATGVTFEQQWAGQGFIDSKAQAVVNLLRQFMIQEELAILFGANTSAAKNQFAGGAVGTPATLTQQTTSTTPTPGNVGAPTTGGSLLAGTWTVQVAGVTGMGQSIASAALSITLGGASTGQLVINPNLRTTLPIIKWNVYVVASGTAGAAQDGTYTFSTTGPTIALQNVVKSGTAVGGAVYFSAGSAISGAIAQNVIGSGVSIPAADTTASAQAYNGLFTQIYGSTAASDGTYVWAGTGNNSFESYRPGATVNSALNTLVMTGSGSNSLEQWLATMWGNAFADPSWLLAYQSEARTITKATLGAGTPYYVVVPQGQQNDATANFRVSRFTNPITGSEVEVKVHPYFSQGTMLAGSDKLPDWFTPTEIPATMAMDCLQDYIEVDYPPVYSTASNTGDTWVVQIMNMCTFKLFVPNVFGAMDSIAQS